MLVLLGAGTITFGLIAWATPSTYTAVLLAGACRASQNRAYLLQQDRHRKGLRHIIVDLQLKSPQLLLLSVQRRQHQDRHVRRFAHTFADAEAVDFRQHHVQQDQIKILTLKCSQRLHPIAHQCRRVACMAQIGLQNFLNVRFVFHDQYLFQMKHLFAPVYHRIVNLS